MCKDSEYINVALKYVLAGTKSRLGLIIAGGQKPFRNECPCIIHIICVVCGNFCKEVWEGGGEGGGGGGVWKLVFERLAA